MKYVFLLFLLLTSLYSAKAIEINEIMYNPAGDDNGNEWLEIYNPEAFDLTNWTIGDLNSNDTLVAIKITNSSFALVVENSSLFADSNASIYFAGSLIGNGLGNTGDTIFLYDANKTIVDSVSYNSTFANGNNKTIEKYNNSWHESIAVYGTPGFENSIISFFENISNVNDSNNSYILNDTATNLTNMTNQTGNATIEACFAFIGINTTKFVYEDESIKFRHIVNSSSDNYSILYWIEDLFGDTVKSPYETKTLTEKSFTPHPYERDTVYIIKSILKTGCENQSAEKIVIYKTNEITEENDVVTAKKETIATNASENKTKFSYELVYYNETIAQNEESSAVLLVKSDSEPHQVKITSYIYRYSRKYSEVYEESFTIEKNEEKSIEIPIFTNASAGEYKLKVRINKDSQKTDYEITKNVTIMGGYEEKKIEYENKELNKTGENYLRTSINITNPPVVYQSKQIKSQGLLPVAIIIVLALLSAVLVWKR